MASMKFKRDFLMDELGLPMDAIEDDVTDVGRWSIHHDIIFEHEGKFYKTSYSEGATEHQWESPWEGMDLINCYEVEKKEVLVEKWVKVD